MVFLLHVFVSACIFSVVITVKLIFWGRLIATQLWPLSKIPGPWWARYTRLWLVQTLASGKSPEKFIQVNGRYGPLARIGPNHLLTDDPEVTRRILAPRSAYTRAPCFDTLRIDPTISNIVSERDIKRHQSLRLKLSPGYSGRDIGDIEQVIDCHLLNWVHNIELQCESGPSVSQTIDIGRQIQFLTVDIISELSLGESFRCVESNSDRYDFLASVEQAIKSSQHLSVIGEANTLFHYATQVPLIRRLIVPSPTDEKGLGKVMGLARRAMERHFKSCRKPARSLLSSFVQRGVAREQIDTEAVISLVAGSESTSTSIQSVLLAIVMDVSVYRKVQLEVDTALARGLATLPVRYAEAQQLPYLSACIMEGLRKHPPAAQLRERMVPPEGDYINGYRVPGGTYIGFNTWGTQLNEIFGEDYEVFRPERWLIKDVERVKAMRRTVELVFGHGSTKCLGMPIAMTELFKTIFELLRHFDITVANPQSPWTSVCYGIFFQTDFNVRITPRRSCIDI